MILQEKLARTREKWERIFREPISDRMTLSVIDCAFCVDAGMKGTFIDDKCKEGCNVFDHLGSRCFEAIPEFGKCATPRWPDEMLRRLARAILKVVLEMELEIACEKCNHPLSVHFRAEGAPASDTPPSMAAMLPCRCGTCGCNHYTMKKGDRQ